MRVDSHHHFWRYNAVEYDWIDDAMASLRRDFQPADLAAELRAAGFDGAVSVQARQCVEETETLLAHAEANPFLFGVVGWLPLASPDIESLLERFAGRDKLKGLRHVLQGEPNALMQDAAFNHGVSLLERRDLAYDILIYARQLPAAIAFVDRHPNQPLILDHIAKPRIRENILEPWRSNLRELARRENVWCKISGLVTEADYARWTEAQLRPYLDATLEAFGPERLMFGSDWPVCRVACEYARWAHIVRDFAAPLSQNERDALFGGTAAAVYRLEEPA